MPKKTVTSVFSGFIRQAARTFLAGFLSWLIMRGWVITHAITQAFANSEQTEELIDDYINEAL